MPNEHNLNDLWPHVRARGASALKPDLARRVIERARAAREDLSPAAMLTIGIGTAMACLALTLSLNSWRVHKNSENAIEQWVAFNSDSNGGSDQDI